jgi:ankyrin repeat protein
MKLYIFLILSFASGILTGKIINNKLNPILLESVYNKDTEGLKELFAGYNIPDINIKNGLGNTPIITASINGYARITKLLIDNDADINIRNDFGKTALMCAAHNNHINIMKILIERGANINIKDNTGKTARDYADNRHDFDRIVAEYIIKIRSIIEDQLIPDVGSIVRDYI